LGLGAWDWEPQPQAASGFAACVCAGASVGILELPAQSAWKLWLICIRTVIQISSKLLTLRLI
jgi:hypothetical protein